MNFLSFLPVQVIEIHLISFASSGCNPQMCSFLFEPEVFLDDYPDATNPRLRKVLLSKLSRKHDEHLEGDYSQTSFYLDGRKIYCKKW